MVGKEELKLIRLALSFDIICEKKTIRMKFFFFLSFFFLWFETDKELGTKPPNEASVLRRLIW